MESEEPEQEIKQEPEQVRRIDPGECELCLSGFKSALRYECPECGRFVGSCCWSISSNLCLECRELGR